MHLPIPNIVQELWNAWNLRSCILLSLWLQVILVLFAFLRKRTRSKLVHGLIWFAYLLADWIAPVAIGLISKSEGVAFEAKVNKDLMAFWASFLLLHLGGPDTITSFALEDNEFWLRHLVGLILQIVATAYIFYQSLPNKLWAPTIMVFLVGCIKYGERTHALFLASLDHLRSELPKPDPGPDYEEVMKIRLSNSRQQVEIQVDVMPSLEDEDRRRSYSADKTLISANGHESTGERKPFDNMQLVQEAQDLFNRFKGLIVGHFFSSKAREWSRELFLTITPAEAFRLIECELNFMYEYLHTKVAVVRCTFGYFLRFISFTLIAGALTFFSIENHHEFHHVSKFDYFDIILTYVLLVGALGLEAISVLMLILSDRTLLAVKGCRSKRVEKFLLNRRRWSKSVSQYDMINYCLKDPPTWAYTLASYVGAGEVLAKMNILWFSHSKRVNQDLESFIFTELSLKSRNANTIREARDASSQIGNWSLLQTSSYFKLKWSIGEYQYAESLLVWHMATELLYSQEIESSPGFDRYRETCKFLSDYLFYLVFIKPEMIAPALSGKWEIVFQDTHAEAKKFFHKHAISNRVEACRKINAVETKYRSADVKGTVSKSVFFDGSLLAKDLSELEIDKWKLMSRVWVELTSFAAINCSPNIHAQQISRGGELLTYIWLLMNHLGYGTQFYEQERRAKAKMVPFHTFKGVVIPELQCHLSKVKKSLPHPPQKDEARDTINGKNEEDNSNCNDDLDPHVIFDDIQSDLNSINKACRELKLWADRVNQEIQALILQGLDDAFKGRTEALEISLRIDQLRRTKEVVSMLKKQICSSPQLSPDSLQSESLPHSRSSMRTDFLPESPGQKPEENINQMFIKSSTLIEFEEIYKGLDDTQKKCLLCFSIFPENETIKKKVLIHWWVGEGFMDGETAEETGSKYFKDFIDKGIIERVHKKRRKKSENFKMKPSIRDTIIKLAEEDGFVSFDSKGNPTADFSSCPRVCLVKTEDGSSLRDFTYIYHYLDHEKIQTLFNVNEPQLNFRVGRFSKMKNLKVLQLGWWRASARQLVEVEDTDFLQGMKEMKQLRYVSLRGISRITELPNSICELSNLRILNLNACDNLEKLPDGIGSLKQLTHLDMSECFLISHMPKGLTCLSELRILKGFVIGTQRSRGHYCKLADLAVLQHLKKMSIHVDKTEDAEHDLLSLAQFGNLRSLSVAWSCIYNATTSTTTNEVLAKIHRILNRKKSMPTTPGSPSQPVDLHKLGLQNFHGSKMPDWLRLLNLKNLKKLYIRGGELSDLRLPGDQGEHSWAVECLRLKSLSQLRMDWTELQLLFPNLIYVEKVDCPQLSSFPCEENGEWIHNEADTEQA